MLTVLKYIEENSILRNTGKYIFRTFLNKYSRYLSISSRKTCRNFFT